MTTRPTLSAAHQRTYDRIFQHPVSHNLGWHDVHALFRHLGQIEEMPNGNFRVTHNGQTLILPPARTKDVEQTDEVMKLRHFLDHSGTVRTTATTGPAKADARWLLVINHHEARIFPSLVSGTAPLTIQPPHATSESHGYSGLSRGQEKPDASHFFDLVVPALKAAGQILVFGSGKGGGSEMDRFLAWAKIHHADLAGRIAGSQVIDEHHLTDTQLLAQARAFHMPAANLVTS